MIRFLNLIAICALIGSAGYAYSVKYESLSRYERLAKLKTQLKSERDALAVLKAEWALLNRPERLQAAVNKHLDLQAMDVKQLARFSDLTDRPERGDLIGKKLELLGLFGSTSTPADRGVTETTGSTTQTPNR